jgi:hypothetical protein
MFMTDRVFKRLEAASPTQFSLGNQPNYSFQKPLDYWPKILGGQYRTISDSNLRNTCRTLRILFITHLCLFIFTAAGIFIHSAIT